MATFNDRLLKVHESIVIDDKDRASYTHMYDDVRDWLMKEMRDADPLFKKLFKGTELFGSYSNSVRIIKPSEFDVSILLKLPFLLTCDIHTSWPGFAAISSEKWIWLEDSSDYKKIFEGNLLSRIQIQEWISALIKSVLLKRPAINGYIIKHQMCNVAQTIYVQDGTKKISIDFVPSILMDNVTFCGNVGYKYKQFLNGKEEDNFLAVPKTPDSKGCHPKCNIFQLANPSAERRILWDKQNLKVVYRLLKSLRDNKKPELKKLKSYFLTTIFLLEVEKQPANFWHKQVADIFMHMLKVLLEYFRRGFLPFYWFKDQNLLSIFKDDEIKAYTKILSDLFYNLESAARPPYSRVDHLFKTSL